MKNKLDMDFTPKQLMQDIREHDTRGYHAATHRRTSRTPRPLM